MTLGVMRCAPRGSLSRWPRHVPRRTFAAAVYLGAIGGGLLGVTSGALLLADFVAESHGSAYGDGFGLFALVLATCTGTLCGVMVGGLNGLVITALARGYARSGSSVPPGSASVAMVVSTALGSVALLGVVMHGMNWLFIYPPAGAATLIAWPLSRRLATAI